jgi:hypothetical protein
LQFIVVPVRKNGTRPRHSARLRSQHPLALSELAFVTRLRHDMTSASSGYLFVLQMSAFDLKRTWPFQHCSSIRYDELFLSPGAEGGVATWPLSVRAQRTAIPVIGYFSSRSVVEQRPSSRILQWPGTVR